MKKQPEQTEPNSTDLKHDNLEFAATDSDNAMDTDDPAYEEEGISAEELDAIEDEPSNEALALIAEETDYLADEDNLPEEDWTDDIENEDGEDDEAESNHHRE
ncbi:MAG: hypothetical protein WDM90_17315 [Ferruginibacter sp.]